MIVGDNSEGAVVTKIDFSSERKRMSSVIDLSKYSKKEMMKNFINENYIILCKGASEIMLNKCTKIL